MYSLLFAFLSLGLHIGVLTRIIQHPTECSALKTNSIGEPVALLGLMISVHTFTGHRFRFS
jgi:hypothetical protein